MLVVKIELAYALTWVELKKYSLKHLAVSCCSVSVFSVYTLLRTLILTLKTLDRRKPLFWSLQGLQQAW